MNNWMKKIKVKAILPAAAFIAAAAIGTTFAWQTWNLSVTNQLKSHATKVLVDETFNDEKPWDQKKVIFKNEGSSSVFLRVSYTEHWEKENEIFSNQKEGKDIAEKIWADHFDEDWEFIDGWYYYKGILKAGASTRKMLEKVNEPNPYPDEYCGAKYYLYFKAEVVQCSDGSNTLNSDEVNKEATRTMFGKEATIDPNTGIVSWK